MQAATVVGVNIILTRLSLAWLNILFTNTITLTKSNLKRAAGITPPIRDDFYCIEHSVFVSGEQTKTSFTIFQIDKLTLGSGSKLDPTSVSGSKFNVFGSTVPVLFIFLMNSCSDCKNYGYIY